MQQKKMTLKGLAQILGVHPSTGEIFAAFPDLEPDTDELRDLYDMFESRGVKVLDEIAAEGSEHEEPPAA